MNKIEEIKKDLKNILSSKRYEHSIGTMEKARNLAKKYGEDEEKAALTGLAHDIAKEMTINEYKKYIKETNIQLTQEDKNCTNVLHGIIGADIVKKKYNFTDEMCRAIYYHTTGINNMTIFEKIIFLADKIEEKTRTKESTQAIDKIIKEKGLDEAIIYIIDNYTIPKIQNNNGIIHSNTVKMRNSLL